MKRTPSVLFLLLASLMMLITDAGPAQAQREPIDRVVAQVDDEFILLSDVLQEMNLVRMQRGLGRMSEAEQQELFDQVLNGMIDDQLLVVAAREKGFEPGDREVQAEVDKRVSAIKQQLGGEDAYRQELERQGMNEADVRDMHREQAIKQILAARIIESELRSKVNVTEDQVLDFYRTKRDSLPAELLRSPEKLRLAHILIVPRTEATQKEAAKRKAEAALQRIRDGEEFAEVAKDVSEWPNASRGGDLGEFSYGDFSLEGFDETVSKLEPGETSDVFETNLGYMIVKLESRNGSKMTARMIILKTDPGEDGMVEALERAQELKRRIERGEGFEELAARFSDDPTTRDNGGELDNEWKPSDLLPEFRDALEGVGVGEVTDVVRSTNGFHIIKVLQRTQSHENNFEDIEAALRRYLEQRQLESLFNDYVHDLREHFYVSIDV
jgi:peptidyl-prolyl cis-trans isomerase SurA